MSTKTILLCAGGTAGHLFPAFSLGKELESRGWIVHLATDRRGYKFADNFPASFIHIIESATITRGSIISLFISLFRLLHGYFHSHYLLRRHSISVVVGFGGYPTVPPVLSAYHSGIKTAIHEQNARMGRANRFLSRRVSKVALSFPLSGESDNFSDIFVITGNPMREAVHSAASIDYPKRTKTDTFNLLVFGGSQGSQFFTDLLCDALPQLPVPYLSRLRLTLQGCDELQSTFTDRGICSDVRPFFSDLPTRIASSHLVICRSGAGSVCELSHIGRASILIPLPHSLDDDQGINASLVIDIDGGLMFRQSDFTTRVFLDSLIYSMDNPDFLALQSENVRRLSVLDSTGRLCDLVESLLE